LSTTHDWIIIIVVWYGANLSFHLCTFNWVSNDFKMNFMSEESFYPKDFEWKVFRCGKLQLPSENIFLSHSFKFGERIYVCRASKLKVFCAFRLFFDQICCSFCSFKFEDFEELLDWIYVDEWEKKEAAY
jgi:hypothetical protein